MIVRLSLLSLTVLLIGFLADAGSAADKEKPPPSAKQRRDDIDKLIEQLSAEDFKVREAAARKLTQREDALPALKEAAKSDDAEVSRRARKAIESINKRLGKRAIERAIAKLKKGQTDQFVDQVVRWREYADDDCWKAALEHALAVAAEAGKATGSKFKVLPGSSLANLKFIQSAHLKIAHDHFLDRQRVIAESVTVEYGLIRNSFVLCAGSVESKLNMGWSVVFANGNVKMGDRENLGGIGNCIVVCDGDVKVSAHITDSVILSRGNVTVGANVRNSVIISGGEVKVGVDFPGAPIQNSLIQAGQNDPLRIIHFFDLAQSIEVKASQQQVRVERVSSGKCFAQAGICKGDRIVAVDGVKVASMTEFRRLLRRSMQASNSVRIQIRRGNQILDLDVRVAGDSP